MNPHAMVTVMKGLDRAESVCLWLDVPFQRQGDVLTIDKGNVYLRIGFYDEHFLVYIGVHPSDNDTRINWVGFDPMREQDLIAFLQNTLPVHIDPTVPQYTKDNIS